jgi:xylan 1,4-beta-xylosidase
MNAETIRAKGVRGNPDVSAFASLDKNKLAVLVWHYHDDDLPGPPAAVELTLESVPFASGRASLTEYRIDATHSNS